MPNEAHGISPCAGPRRGGHTEKTATIWLENLIHEGKIPHLEINPGEHLENVGLFSVALGANATPMPYGEVYTALKTGIVDGAENNWPSYESSRHFEAAKFYSLSEHSMAPEVLVFSRKIWDTLSRDDQAAIRRAARDSVPHMRTLWDAREDSSRRIVEAAAVQVVPIANKAEFVDAMKPVYAKFANTPALQSLVKRIQETK